VDGQSVWAHTRCFVEFSRFFLVYEATFDHPPSDSTLQGAKAEQTEKDVAQVRSNVASQHKVSEWPSKNDSDRPADDSVEPFPEEDELEA